MARQHAHHAAPATFYLAPDVLAEQVRECRRQMRRTQQVTNELAASVAAIAGGVWDRYRHIDSRDDFVQEVVLHFLRYGMKRIDPARNVFAFVTTLAIRRGLTLRKVQARRRDRENAHLNLVIDIYQRLDGRRGLRRGAKGRHVYGRDYQGETRPGDE